MSRVASDSAGDVRFDRIVPTPLAAVASAAASDSGAKRAGAWQLPVLFAGLVLVLLAVVLWLPKIVSTPPAAAVLPDTGTAAPARVDGKAPAVAAPPLDVEATLQQRQQAQALAAQAQAQQQNLDAMHAAQWAAADFAALVQTNSQADADMAARDFAAAAHGYAQAIARAQPLQVRAGEVLAAALAEGERALQAGDADAAALAFSRAVSIDANNAAAVAGQRRARNFDALRAQLNRAQAAESAGDLAAARTGFSAVLALAGEDATARAGLARLHATTANAAFAAQMSRGLAALERGDYQAAQAAFNAALTLRAGASEAGDGLQRARLGLQSARVLALRERAQQAEVGEQWLAARDAYAAALAIDGSLAFAQHGRQHAEQRAALAARLQAHIDQAQRLSAQSVRADAQAALADAVGVAAPGPRLQAQIQRLSGLLAAATTPVAVTLRSDGKTAVTLYPIGEIGAFASHSLSLPPGQYTAIGRRPGYREVRVAFTVTAQGIADLPVIQCEEPI